MIEVADRLFVGSERDYVTLPFTGWTVVHAAKEPYHREFVGYSTRGAPKDSPEYLYAVRGNRLAMNLFDANDPSFVNYDLMRVAVSFIRNTLNNTDLNVLVHCNQGRSRAPTVAMLALAPDLGEDFEEAKFEFSASYPNYFPSVGLEEFARANWNSFRRFQ